MDSLSIVIPVYNSEHSIGKVVEQLHIVLPDLTDQFEIILVEDNSQDRSWAVIEQLVRTYTSVRGMQLMRNYGQHNALLCGIRAAQHDMVVTMDDDLQHPPEEIERLLNKLSEGFDVVYGSPIKERHGLFRDMASQVTKLVLQGAMGAENARNLSAFRVFRTRLREGFAAFSGPSVNLDVLLTWSTGRFTAIQVEHASRETGESNYTFRKLVRHTFNLVTGFSTLPLQLASLLGFILTFVGVLILVYVIGVRVIILGYDVPGFTFTASMISIFSGAQMFMLGIIGEYLSRMHFRTMDKPSYVIREDTHMDDLSERIEPEPTQQRMQ